MGYFKSKIIKEVEDTRLIIACMTKMISFSVNIIKGVYKGYINHDKIIAWSNGCPVYSSFSPPALSKVQANMEARNTISIMQNRKHPNMINIAITDKCNCNCIHCSFKSMKLHQQKRKVLNTNQIKKVIHDAQQLGVCTIMFSGGEPLMRKDIYKLIKSVDKDLSVTLLFTNGWFLKENVKKLKKAGLNSVNVSIDSSIPKKHDLLRNKKRLFLKTIEGIKAAKKQGLIVGISSCLSKKQVESGELDDIIRLGKKLKVNEIIIFDNIPTGKLIHRNDIINDQSWTQNIIDIVNKYNKRYDFPAVYSYSHIKSYKGLGCSGGTTFFYVSPYGDICPCDFNPLVIGNVLKTPLYLIWDKLSHMKEFNQASFKGCKMLDQSYRKKFLKI
tara:strand:- start:24392 stop:25549 length:1158 start_codon:yes stop_codon:yes gene_type:complete